MKKSKVYLYDWETHEQVNAMEGDCYIDGSHDTDWEGILVEKVRSTGTVAENVYIKDCHILLSLDDQLSFTKNGTEVDPGEEDIVIAARNKQFSVKNPEPFTGIFLTISMPFMKQFFYDNNIDELEFLDYYRLDDPNLKYMVMMIYEQAIQGVSQNDGFVIKLFETLCVYYIHNYSNYFKCTHGLFTKKDLTQIDNYIQERLAEPITTKAIADRLKMSHYMFMKEFRNYTGMAPSKYILKIKFDLAKQRLITTDQTVTEIALSLGFFDNSHFSKTFKKRFMMTPNQYRHSHK